MPVRILEAMGAFGHIPQAAIYPIDRIDQMRYPFELYGNVPEFEELTQKMDGSLGCIVIPQISEGDLIPLEVAREVKPKIMRDSRAILADFGAIDVLQDDLLGQFQSFQRTFHERYLSDSSDLAKQFNSLDMTDQQLFQGAIFTGQIASKFFQLKLGNMTGANMRIARNFFSWRPIDPEEFHSPLYRKLSTTADEGVCAEIAIFSQEVMKRIGFSISYSTGYLGRLDPELHSFLPFDNGRIIFDPSMMISDKERGGLAGLMIADPFLVGEGVTYRANPSGYGCHYQGVGGDIRYYSCSK